MKKILISLIFSFYAVVGFAQWTNNGSNLTTTDKVGIGTTSPNNVLEIGNAFSFHDGGHTIIGLGWAAGPGGDLSSTRHSAAIRLDPAAGTISLGVSATKTSFPQQTLFVTKNNRIGIGKSNPKDVLEIANAFSFHDGGHDIFSFGYSQGGGGTDLNPTGYASEIRMDPTNGKMSFGVSTLVTSPPVRTLYITKDGKVGIGAPNPDHLLTVAGRIHARSIECTVNAGADFVFEESYDLMPLSELEAFVTQKKHLPEIAPAAEMEKEGICLEEMNIKLLQKVEELTLYMIQQQKEIEALDQKVQKLNASSGNQ